MSDALPPIEAGRNFATLAYLTAEIGVPWLTLNRIVRENGIVAAMTINGVAHFDENACGLIWEALDKAGVRGLTSREKLAAQPRVMTWTAPVEVPTC